VLALALGPLIVPPVIAFIGWLPGMLAGPVARLATACARSKRYVHIIGARSLIKGNGPRSWPTVSRDPPGAGRSVRM